MNPLIKKLADISSKPAKTIIGLMSGTSLDGLDIALCNIRGSGENTEVKLKKFESQPYDSKTKKRLRAISSVPKASIEEVCLLHSWLGDFHGKLILKTLSDWQISPSTIDCIASHGQTIYHAPKTQHKQEDMPNATLQIGDADHIAHTTGILTLSDFRQKQTAAGGEGAPMVSFVDRMLYTDDTEERILLNIGGIANFTYLPARNSSKRTTITTDTGPGNTLIDAAVQEHFSQDYDKDGKIARRGSVNETALKTLKSDHYFQQPLPKTTGPEVFNLDWVNKQLKKADIDELSPENLVATLTRLSAETIVDSVQKFLTDNQCPVIYISGGGMHNPVLMEWIQKLIPQVKIKSFDNIGFDPDAKEAALFAVLANEMLSGEGFLMSPNSSNNQKINFGKISLPT
jgi:anhydro-N-acetylmuramic acid kinase